MSNYLDFTPTVDWAKLRVYYEETYDEASNASTFTVTSVEVMSTSYRTMYWVDGIIKINGETVFTAVSAHGTVSVNFAATNAWYPILKSSSPITASAQIVHDHENSNIVTIELTGNTWTTFGFFNDSTPNWGVNEVQTVTLEHGGVEEELVIPDHAYGSQEYLFKVAKLPKLPSRNKELYPVLFIKYHKIDGNGFFSLFATNTTGPVENDMLTSGGNTFSYKSWIIAADEAGDTMLQNIYTKATNSEWYEYEETEATELNMSNVFWTNVTLTHADTSVYLESSKGIWLIDLKDWLMGYVLGTTQKFNKIEPEATLTNGVLYIQNANTRLINDVLEVT